MRETGQSAVAKKDRRKVHRGEPGCHNDVKRRMVLIDIEEIVNHCGAKISFVSEFFHQETPGKLEISDGAICGLLLFLQDIEDDLDRINDQIQIAVRGEKERIPKRREDKLRQ
jgi:hypothetical protein